MVFEFFVHSYVFLGSVDPFDSSEGVGESVEIEYIFDVNQSRETLMVTLSLPLPPQKDQPMLNFYFVAVVFDSFTDTFLLLEVALDVIPDAAHC